MSLYPFGGFDMAASGAAGIACCRFVARGAAVFVRDAGFLRDAAVLPWQPAGPEA
jgi:hypothetical protein